MPHTYGRIVRTALLTLASLAFTVTVFASPARAHSDLLSSNPESGQTLADVSTVTLTFVDEIVPEYTTLSLIDANGIVFALQQPMFDARNTQLTVDIESGSLPDGNYLVGYYIVSIDGHPIEGSIEFAIAESPVGPSVPDAMPSDGTVPDPETSASVVPLAIEARSSGAPDDGLAWVWIGTGIASVGVLAAVSTVLLVAIRRRRDTTH
jgi:methionine-rich copper-binding protein CopC